MEQPRYTATHWGNYLVGQADDGQVFVQPVSQDPEPSPIGRSLADTHDRNSRVASVRRWWTGLSSQGRLRPISLFNSDQINRSIGNDLAVG